MCVVVYHLIPNWKKRRLSSNYLGKIGGGKDVGFGAVNSVVLGSLLHHGVNIGTLGDECITDEYALKSTPW